MEKPLFICFALVTTVTIRAEQVSATSVANTGRPTFAGCRILFDERRDAGPVMTIGEANNLNNNWRLDLMFSAPIILDTDARPVPDEK